MSCVKSLTGWEFTMGERDWWPDKTEFVDDDDE